MTYYPMLGLAALIVSYFACLGTPFSLYKDPNHSGFIQEFSLYERELCKNLSNPETKVGSVDTLGGCYVLYERKGCRGNNLQVFSREFAYHNMERVVSSVGVCTTTVDLFGAQNYRGYKESIKVYGVRDCVSVGKRWSKNPIESVKLNGGCVIVHDGPDCNAHSLKLNSGSTTNYNLRQWNFRNNVRSISACSYFDLWRSKTDIPNQFVLYNQYDRPVYAGNSNQCGCQIVDAIHKGTIKSVATNGQCITLYRNNVCAGQGIKLDRTTGSYSDVEKLPMNISLRNCDTNKMCTNMHTISNTRRGKSPLFGQYLLNIDGVIIKSGSIPSMDHFCELTRRCTGNRHFDCAALKNEGRCYCHGSRRVSCDSGTLDHLNHKNVKEEENFRFPLAGEFNTKARTVYFASSSYETPFSKPCELARRCSKEKQKCSDEEDSTGGNKVQIGCNVDAGFVFSVAPAGAGIKARPPVTVEEDEEFGSLQ